jgi:alpha-L-rhamnosidase
VAGLGGIRRTPGLVGYQRFELRPTWGLPLEGASASFVSPHGKIESEWRQWQPRPTEPIGVPVQVSFNVTVPVNTLARVFIPARNVSAVREGNVVAIDAFGVRLVDKIAARVRPGFAAIPQLAVFLVGSGSYTFRSHY